MALKARYLVALATALAFGLALYQLGHESLWHDEFLTWRWASLPFAEIWLQASVRDFHPPLYFWFMHGWLKLSPAPDDFWLRLPSALFFALTVPMVYLVGRSLGGTSRAGVYAAFLAATFPFLLHYGQEARPYAMLTFFAACGFAAVARLVRECRDGARPRLIGAGLVDATRLLARGDWRAPGLSGGRSCDPHTPGLHGGRSCDPHTPGLHGGRSCDPHTPGQALRDDGAWVAYIVSSVLVMWLHNTAGLYPVVTGLILVCAIGMAPSFRGIRFANLCIAMALIALLYLPQVPYLLSGVDRISLSWIRTPDADGVLRMFREVYGGSYRSLLLLTFLALIAMAVPARRGRWEWVAFALLGWLLAPMLLIAFSFWKPIVQNKLLIWSVIPLLAACGAGLALVTWTVVRAAVLAVLLALNLQGVAEVWKFVRNDWKGVSRTIEREAAPGAAILICPARWPPRMFDRYWGGTRKDLRFHVVDFSQDRGRVLEFADRRPRGRRGPEVSPAGLFAQYPEVWLIWNGICSPRLGFLTRLLEETGQLMETWKYGLNMRLGLYRRNE